MENELPVRRPRNTVPGKMETKMKSGPVLHRAALGYLHNKPSVIQANANIKLTKTHGLKSDFDSLRLKPPVKKKSGKENVPVALPPVQSTARSVDESMEVEEEVEELSMAFSSQMIRVKDIDVEDAGNPQLVSAYVKDVYKYMWKLEREHKVNCNYLDGQHITSRMRSILIDWLVQVHLRFTLLQETLYLTVAIVDRFLQTDTKVTKEKLQLVGVTAMFIASKYEEMYIPEIGDFAYVTDKAFSKKDIRVMEVHMLTTLKFYVSFPLPLHFLRRNSKAGQVDAVHHTLAKYLMELTLPEYSFSSFKASLIAAGALYLSMQIVGDGTKWDEVMAFYSNYSEKEILPVVCKMSSLIIRSTISKQQAIRSKYKSSKLMKISDIPELKPTSRLLRNYAERVFSN